jgi:tetratricopeptide (TPR) repeat protein
MNVHPLRVLVPFLLALAAGSAQAQFWDPRALAIDPATATEPVAPVLSGLGDLHRAVTTSNPKSQQFFDQGLRLAYGFNHSEAIRAYKEAARLDPDNAMAYWGVAYALGPNLNLPMMPDVTEQAYASAQKAMSLRDKVTPVERDLIEAMAKRYASPAPEDRSALDRAFADAMRDVHAKYPADPDVATVYADALMNLSPWNYWYADGSSGPNADVIVDTLESVLRRYPDHIGALHLHIHAVEAPNGKRAETSADRLLRLAPAAGHLVHMPSHIYMRTGRYADAYAANLLADAADNEYVAQCKAQGIYPLFYHRHNQHFLTWAAMFQGRSAAALEAGRLISHGLDPATLAASGPLSETIQHLMSQPLYVMVRFGEWDAILKEPQPVADYGFMNAIWHYARGMAYANTGKARDAKKELAAVEKAAGSEAMKDKMVGFSHAPAVLTVATQILGAEIDAAAGDRDRAIAKLDRAVRIQDGFRYNEPPDWYFPARHYLGAELLDAGRAAEAETVYWQDLARNPANGYALYGLQQAIEKQGRTAEAQNVAAQFQAAWKDADVKLTSSRF